MIPWAMLDYRDALLAWNVLSLAMLVASLEIIRRSLELPLNLELIAQMVIFLLLSSPLFMQLFHGQWNLILLLLITSAWAAERSGRPAWAGVLLGVATAIKLYPGFLFLYFLARRRWTGLIAGALAFGMLTGLTAAVLGPLTYRVYIQEVLPTLAAVSKLMVQRLARQLLDKALRPLDGRRTRPAPVEEPHGAACRDLALGTRRDHHRGPGGPECQNADCARSCLRGRRDGNAPALPCDLGHSFLLLLLPI